MPVSIGVALVCLALQCVTSHGVVYRRVAHSKYPNIWAECTTAEEPTQTSPRPFVAPPPVVKSVAPPPPAVSDTIPTATTTTSAFNQPILPSNTNKAPIVSVAPSPSPIVVLPESIAASPSPQPVTPPPPSPPVSNDPSIPYVQLPSGFPGVNTGIASWFRANNPQDSTNGNSWCGYPYNDNMPVFAPDIWVMTGTNYNVVYPDPLWAPSATKYCGLEAWVYSPSTGVNMTLYVGDAFDHYWVKTPGSIDVMINPYRYLAQRPTVTDKNAVLKDVQWAFTGRRRLDYAFKARGGG